MIWSRWRNEEQNGKAGISTNNQPPPILSFFLSPSNRIKLCAPAFWPPCSSVSRRGRLGRVLIRTKCIQLGDNFVDKFKDVWTCMHASLPSLLVNSINYESSSAHAIQTVYTYTSFRNWQLLKYILFILLKLTETYPWANIISTLIQYIKLYQLLRALPL